MLYLLIFVALILLILIHEAGHLAAARLVGIPVAEFSFGFGPRVWSRRRRGTAYSLRAVPLGGFVLPAMEPQDFRRLPLLRRLAYFLGGPLVNWIAALPLLAADEIGARGLSLHTLLVAPVQRACELSGQILGFLPALLTQPEALSGPLGILAAGAEAAEGGAGLVSVAVLSLSLAVMNLLPIPGLDGGQILLAVVEDGFPQAARLRVPLTLAGAALLVTVTVYASLHDLARIWG
jgi:regulator of sigma E protease